MIEDPKPEEPTYNEGQTCWTYRGRCFYARGQP
jgi:hypothetical protein